MKTHSKLNLERVVREGIQGRGQPEVKQGFLQWAGSREGQTEALEAKSNWMESIEYYYMIQHQSFCIAKFSQGYL